MTIDDERLDRMIREAAPRSEPGPELDDVLDRLAAGIARPRRGARWVAPLAAGAVLLSTAAAGYAIWHDTASGDFERAAAARVAALELPPGTDRAAYVAQLAEQGRRSPSSISDLGLNSSASYYAVCAWLTAWDRRQAAGDTAGAAGAVAALDGAVAADPLRATDGGGVVDHLRRVAAAAGRGDREPVAAELGANCAGLPLGEVR
jgi:hypothetical protein